MKLTGQNPVLHIHIEHSIKTFSLYAQSMEERPVLYESNKPVRNFISNCQYPMLLDENHSCADSPVIQKCKYISTTIIM